MWVELPIYIDYFHFLFNFDVDKASFFIDDLYFVFVYYHFCLILVWKREASCCIEYFMLLFGYIAYESLNLKFGNYGW